MKDNYTYNLKTNSGERLITIQSESRAEATIKLKKDFVDKDVESYQLKYLNGVMLMSLNEIKENKLWEGVKKEEIRWVKKGIERRVICHQLTGQVIREFKTYADGARWLKGVHGKKATPQNLRGMIATKKKDILGRTKVYDLLWTVIEDGKVKKWIGKKT